MSAENKVLVRKWFEEVWNRGRAAAIDEMLAGNAVLHGFGPQPTGFADFKKFHADYRNAFPDVAINVDAMITEGDIAAVRWSARGTHGGSAFGMAATGRPVQLSGMGFVRIDGGRIVEAGTRFDQLGWRHRLRGLRLPPRVGPRPAALSTFGRRAEP